MTVRDGRLLISQRPKAMIFALGLTGSGEEAQELVQEALYKTVRFWKRYDHKRPLDTWLRVVLKNLLIDNRRHCEHKKVVSLDSPMHNGETSLGAELSDGGEDLLDALERKETADMVEKTFETLRRTHRQVLALWMNGSDYEEAAHKIGIPTGTVRSRLHRARKAFKKKFLRLTASMEPAYV